MAENLDLRAAINAVSDVVANRPPPLREFDQIYMKVADMVIQAHFVANRFHEQSLVFIGDGDAIGLVIMHLGKCGIFDRRPSSVTVLDFDERIVNSITRFAEKYEFSDQMNAQLYNVIDSLPDAIFGQFDAFYTNPPWGQSNGGQSVSLFLERGIEACRETATGSIVIADDPAVPWTQEVLYAAQRRAAELGFVVAEMIPQMHHYHLDDAPDLRSCACVFRRVHNDRAPLRSLPADPERLANFYGRKSPLIVRYVKAKATLNYGRAPDDSYELVPVE